MYEMLASPGALHMVLVVRELVTKVANFDIRMREVGMNWLVGVGGLYQVKYDAEEVNPYGRVHGGAGNFQPQYDPLEVDSILLAIQCHEHRVEEGNKS